MPYIKVVETRSRSENDGCWTERILVRGSLDCLVPRRILDGGTAIGPEAGKRHVAFVLDDLLAFAGLAGGSSTDFAPVEPQDGQIEQLLVMFPVAGHHFRLCLAAHPLDVRSLVQGLLHGTHV